MQHFHDATETEGTQEIAAAQRRLVQMLAKAVAERLVIESRNSETTSSAPQESITISPSTPS